MKIKDVEHRTGITKASIRYYESENLVTPNREANGYRTYDESHVNTLLRIKLLRTLDIPIEILKDLCSGTITLEEALSVRNAQFQEQHQRLDLAETVVKMLLEADISYEDLEPDGYLRLLEDEAAGDPERDIKVKLAFPWRRFWARVLDSALYNQLLHLLLPFLYQLQMPNPLFTVLRTILLNILVLLAVEPVLLCLFGATPGKWVFGISVASLDGNRLTYRQALNRTWQVLRYGLGFYAPFLQEYMHYTSYMTAETGGELVWEQHSELNVRDSKGWRFLVFAALFAALLINPTKNRVQRVVSDMEPTYQGETPYFHVYYIENAEEQETSLPPLVEIGYGELRFFHENHSKSATYDVIGTFEYTPPEGDTAVGLWKLFPNDSPEQRYELRIDEENRMNLDYFEYGERIWNWKLKRVDTLTVGLGNRLQSTRFSCRWFGDGVYDGNTERLQVERIGGKAVLSFDFAEYAPAELVLTVEEVGHDTTTSQLILSPRDNGIFSLELDPDDLAENTRYVYHVPCVAGEYIFAIEK